MAPKLTTFELFMRRLAPVLITIEIFKCRMPTFELFKSSNCLHLKYSKVVSLGMSTF